MLDLLEVLGAGRRLPPTGPQLWRACFGYDLRSLDGDDVARTAIVWDRWSGAYGPGGRRPPLPATDHRLPYACAAI